MPKNIYCGVRKILRTFALPMTEEEYMHSSVQIDQKDLKILGMTSQSPLTHLTKTLTMKKFYVFQAQRYAYFLYLQIFRKKLAVLAVK
ncbi:hypothetical protein AGMMS50262_19220 [Bacteroidia bacterium]|nr:hypothetical protein AGMMS50262_19220 [Bacteroidia bacterium]